MKKILNILEIIGIIVLALGLILGFANLKGWFNNKNRIEFLNWALTSDSGISIELPAAKEFIKAFPPPEGEQLNNLTHLTKDKLNFESGGTINISINYMRKDFSRTTHVATLSDIRTWTSETSYPWISWWLTLIGFLTFFISWCIKKILKSR